MQRRRAAATNPTVLLEFHELRTLADNPELPHDARTNAAAACFGLVVACSIKSTKDLRLRGVLLLCVRNHASGAGRAAGLCHKWSQLTQGVRVPCTLRFSASATRPEPSREPDPDLSASFPRVSRLASRARYTDGSCATPAALEAPANVAFLDASQANVVATLVTIRREAAVVKLRTREAKAASGAAAGAAAGAASGDKGVDDSGAADGGGAPAPKGAAVRAYFFKFKGAVGATPPKWGKGMPWSQAAITWVGVAATLLIMSRLHDALADEFDDAPKLLIGSFGALMTLLFGAPNSPLCQPRNVIGGCTIAALVAIVFGYLVHGAGEANDQSGPLELWVAKALAPATAIAAMAKLGLTHPPAGAAAFIYITAPPAASQGWMFILCPLLAGNVICCVMATVINNLSEKRQYPLYY